jgi:hypothetical protein
MLMVYMISHASFRQYTATGAKEEQEEYVIAIPADLYDLLCLEGFARAFRVFIGKEAVPVSPNIPPYQHLIRSNLVLQRFTRVVPAQKRIIK